MNRFRRLPLAFLVLLLPSAARASDCATPIDPIAEMGRVLGQALGLEPRIAADGTVHVDVEGTLVSLPVRRGMRRATVDRWIDASRVQLEGRDPRPKRFLAMRELPASNLARELDDLLLLEPAALPSDVIARGLDALGPADRESAVRSLSAEGLKRLYHRFEGNALPSAHFVPAGVPDVTRVRHLGFNNLGRPAPREFAKHFYRDANGALWGINVSSTSAWIGDGWFGAEEIPDGSVRIDYARRPPADAPRPTGFPVPAGNTDRLGAAIGFGWLQDRMFKVSEHVSIGYAKKSGAGAPWVVRNLLNPDAYFALVRVDESSR